MGSFVFSQGVVSAIPLIKDPSHLTAPLRQKLVAVVRKTAPLIVMGLVRVLLVKGTEYPVRLLYSCFRDFGRLTGTAGTCIGVWHSLELLHHTRTGTRITGSVAPIHCAYPDITFRITRGSL